MSKKLKTNLIIIFGIVVMIFIIVLIIHEANKKDNDINNAKPKVCEKNERC